jgi:hypothetical protein
MHAAFTHQSEHNYVLRLSTNMLRMGWPALLSVLLGAQQSWLVACYISFVVASCAPPSLEE